MYRAPQNRPIQRQSVPEGMTAKLTERVSIISSAKVVPNHDIDFESPRLVGGYNWIESEDEDDQPTIAVPGLPDLWIGNEVKVGQLKPDIEIPGYLEYADHHGARLARNISRTEPIFHALNSPADMYGVELITDRNSLRKIYGLFTPDAMYGPKPFRIDAQKIGNVVIFSRWEDPEMKKPKAPHPFCFSKSHELATMEQQLQGVVSCHRMIRYGFGGIDMMVRFELDAITESASRYSITKGNDHGDSLAEAMRTTSVKSRLLPLPRHTEHAAGITIHRSPYPSPPLSSFIEKKTRSAKGELDYIDIYGQLVFSQTPHLYVARHNRGNFSSLEKVSLGQGKLRDIARSTEGIMAKSAGMIKEMMDVVEEFGECSFIWKGEGSGVEVWKGEKQVGLSEEAREMLLAA